MKYLSITKYYSLTNDKLGIKLFKNNYSRSKSEKKINHQISKEGHGKIDHAKDDL